jgi:hypothetical protein
MPCQAPSAPTSNQRVAAAVPSLKSKKVLRVRTRATTIPLTVTGVAKVKMSLPREIPQFCGGCSVKCTDQSKT